MSEIIFDVLADHFYAVFLEVVVVGEQRAVEIAVVAGVAVHERGEFSTK